MDSSTGVLGDHWRKHKESFFAKIIAAILCFLLLLLSLMLVDINSHAVNADNNPSSLSEKKSPTPTVTRTAMPSPTATFSPSPTIIPTKTPTATPSPGVTATATRPAPTRGVTTTATMTPSPAASVMPTSSGNQTPSPISAVPTTTNGGGNGGGNGDGTPPALPQGGLFGLSLSSFIIGSLILLGMVGAIFLGLVMLHKRLLPNQTPQVNLPPSGARPWKRVRPESLNGITNAPGGEYFSPGSIVPGTLFQSDGSSFPPSPPNTPPMTGFYAQNSKSFPPSPPNTPPTTGFYAANSLPSADGFMLAADVPFVGVSPATLETKPLVRRVPSSIRLQAMESSGSQSAAYGLQQQHLDRKSEGMPSLVDPFLRDTLKQYIQRGEMPRPEGAEGV